MNRERLDHLLSVVPRLRALVPRLDVCFGHMRLRTAARELDVFLGALSRTGPELSVIHWQTAPLAEVFFAADEGGDYEVELEDRAVTGKLLEKHLLRFEGDALVSVEAAGERWELQGHEWVKHRAERPRIPPRELSERRPFRSPLEVTLDPAQQRIVDLAPSRNVLILGEAGFGKTTVALRRLAAMAQNAKRGFRGAVVVPTEGLRRLTQLMLEQRGVERVEVWTYDKFAATLARKAFPDLPRRESEDTSAEVQRLKRHPALRDALNAYLAEHPRPPLDEDARRKSRALARRKDLHHLFGDSAIVSRIVEAAQLPAKVIKDCTEHTRVQFEDPTELAMAHVDKDALTTIDGRRIDEGTPMGDAESVDVEDFAVMFEVERLRAQAMSVEALDLGTYHCIVVDEAQEFSPLELKLMGRAVHRGGSVIVAGDAAQQVDATASFVGWAAVMEELAAVDHERAVLEVNYRCPPEVTALARAVVEVKEGAPLGSSRGAGAITAFEAGNDFEQAFWLTNEVEALLRDDVTASIAIVCRGPETARAWARTLAAAMPVHLALGGDFRFQPGVLVTTVTEVKGLEFDYVLIPDASPGAYPESPESRRALYVALTRATFRLALSSAHGFSPTLPQGTFSSSR